MPDNLQSKIDALKRLNLSIRQQLEAAELRIPEINAQVQALAALGTYDRLAIEGDIVFQSPYLPNLGASDSCQVYQAVLIVPEGIGVAIFDMEDYLELQRSPDDGLSLLTRFQSFDESSSFVKAALLPQVDPMVERLLHRIGVRST